MSFRAKLLVAFAAIALISVGAVAGVLAYTVRRTFERQAEERTQALVRQFELQFEARGREVKQRVTALAASESLQRIAIALSQNPDPAPFVSEAAELARIHQLEFLDLVGGDGKIISSAHWPARFGYEEPWLLQSGDWNGENIFLRRVGLPEAPALGLTAVRVTQVADTRVFVVGGFRIDQAFVSALVPSPGMEARLLTVDPSKAEVATVPGPTSGARSIHTVPLRGRSGDLLASIVVSASRDELDRILTELREISIAVAVVAVLIALALATWIASRVSAPIRELADAAAEVSRGNFYANVEVTSQDEIGRLAAIFNNMTRDLMEQRDRIVQVERVAAWRELARRLAHELKNPLYPLQITVENLLRAREHAPEEFDEVFRESTQTLLAELANLRTIVARFSDFSKMPAPQLQPVRVHDIIAQTARLVESQLSAPGRAPISVKLDLAPDLPTIDADPALLSRALQNLVLNAIDAMPQGGTLTLRSAPRDHGVRIEIADTGIGLTPEERERIFTPYYTSKQHGTGLGLAIVQSVVSDHHGRITVASEPGRGTTFRIDLPQTTARGAASV